MATFEQHCQETLEKLGDRHERAHQWLDALQPRLGPQHRQVRHNAGGVEYVRQTWGDEAAKAAELHIARDEGGFELKGGLWVPTAERDKYAEEV